MCYSIAPSARILIYMISRTGWQIAPSRLTCGVGGASALRLRALQPVTAPTPRTRAARHGRSERRRRPIAAVAREAVRDPQNRRNSSHARPHTLRVLRGATWRQTSIGQGPTTRPACSPRQLLIPVGFCESEPQQKDGQNLDCRVPKDRRNIVEGQPPHILRVRSRRQRYVHTRARLPATRPARRHAGAVRSSTTLLIRTALRWSAAACCTQAPPPAPPSQQW